MDYKNTINADHNLFYDGFRNLNDKIHSKHPAELVQNEIKKKRDDLDFNILKQAQGLHAPLKLMMERKMCEGIGRLPFLPSSNLMLEVLEGRQDDLEFSDFFKDPMEQEHFIEPSIMMEKKRMVL